MKSRKVNSRVKETILADLDSGYNDFITKPCTFRDLQLFDPKHKLSMNVITKTVRYNSYF